MTNADACAIISIVDGSNTVECGSGGTGRRARLRGVWFTPYGFKSRFPHKTDSSESVFCFFITPNSRCTSAKNLINSKKTFQNPLTNPNPCAIIFTVDGSNTVECGSGGTGRRAHLRGVWFTPYGFKSRFPHKTDSSESVFCLSRVFFIDLFREIVYNKSVWVSPSNEDGNPSYTNFQRRPPWQIFLILPVN